MELKEVVLSTLAELSENGEEGEEEVSSKNSESNEHILEKTVCDKTHDESKRQFYSHLRERILVLFEGFQSPNNKNIEAKIELTLKFLEYLLASIDEELEKMDQSK